MDITSATTSVSTLFGIQVVSETMLPAFKKAGCGTRFQRMQNMRAEETRQSVSAEPISLQDFTRFVQKDFELEAHELAPIPLYLDPLGRGVVSDVDLVGVTQAQMPLAANQPVTESARACSYYSISTGTQIGEPSAVPFLTPKCLTHSL